MAIITLKGEKMMNVPDNPTIPYIEGDGVGKEVSAATLKVVNAAVEKAYNGKKRIEWHEVLAGEKAYNLKGEWLPEETMQAFRDMKVGIKGPLMTPVGGGIRSLNVALRQELDLYVCLRPVRWFKGVESPVKTPEKIDMHIFRENTEDIYAGIEWAAGTPEAKQFYDFLYDTMKVRKVRFPETSAFGVKPVSKEGSQRLIKSALDYAIERGLPSVTLVHKGNIMKFTEGGFKEWGYELAREKYADKVITQAEVKAGASAQGKVILKDCIADAFLQNTLLIPETYSVIATLNLNGDYVSDQLAAMVGGIGIAPGANINYHTGHAIFEATHGTAPDIAGKNIVNPCSMILSAVMMLEYMGWNEAAALITNALEASFLDGYATHDLARFMQNGKSMTTTEFTDALLSTYL